MSTALIILAMAAMAAAWLALHAASEPGPHWTAVLARRYGPWPHLTAAAAVAVIVGVILAPAAVALAAILTVAAGIVAAVVLGWGPGTISRAARRITLRARWTSVARSSDLAVQRDHRRPGIGADSGTLTEIVKLEWTPTISRGRATPNRAGVTYRLRPARGSSIPEIANQRERLAAGLGVSDVIVERISPHHGLLTVIW